MFCNNLSPPLYLLRLVHLLPCFILPLQPNHPCYFVCMHLFKPLHHWHQKTGSGSQQSIPTSRLQILTRFFCTALIPALKFTAGTQHSPTNLFSFPLQLLLSSSCSAESHGLASRAIQEKCSPHPEDAGAALALGSVSLQSCRVVPHQLSK